MENIYIFLIIMKIPLLYGGTLTDLDQQDKSTKRKDNFFFVARVYPLEHLKNSPLGGPTRYGTNSPTESSNTRHYDNNVDGYSTNENNVDFAATTATTQKPLITATDSSDKTVDSKAEKTPKPTQNMENETRKCVCFPAGKESGENDNDDDDDIEAEVNKMFKNFKPPATSQNHDKKHYRLADYIVKYIFKHYPQYEIPLLASVLANGTTHKAFSGMVMEFQQPNNYDILVTDSFSNVNDGSSKKIEQYPSLYQCSKAIRYCSVNPKFCQYQEGDYNTNLIILIPHGGNVKPDNIPDREPGCFINRECFYELNCGVVDPERCPVSTRPEKYSRTIGLRLANNLKNLTGHRPHVIIMELHRSLVDVDRRGAQGAYSDDTKSAWYDFHNFVSLAKQKISKSGLLIDVHSHMHKHGMVELGYAFTKSQLIENNSVEIDMESSSFRSLVQQHNINSKSILTGNRSLGNFLQNKQIEAIPSPNHPKPVFSGYTEKQTLTQVYGSLFGGTIDAVRVSVPRKYGAKKQARLFSRLLAESIKEFMDTNYR